LHFAVDLYYQVFVTCSGTLSGVALIILLLMLF